MTNREPNPGSLLPGGLTEADLLAVVEGEPLPSDRASAVSRTLAAHPAMARELEAMRRDRTRLRDLGEERAPAGLLDAVGSALQPVFERQMLLGLSEGDAVESRPPVSMVIPRRRTLLSSRPLAVAAGLALVAGGVIFTAISLNRGAPVRGTAQTPMSPVGSLALRKDATSIESAAAPTVSAPLRKVEPETLVAKAAAPKIEPVIPADEPQYGPEAPADAMAETVLASADDAASQYGPPAPAAIEPAQALALAGEHRLIIHVTPADGRFDRVTERLVRAKGAWQLAGAAPIELASILDPQSGQPLSPSAIPDRTQIAGDSRSQPGAVESAGPPASPPSPAGEQPPTPSVYVVNVRLDEATLAAMQSSMRDIGAEITFEEAPRSLPHESAPVTTPGAVVWWGSNPASWSSWGSVPVVIQR